MSGIATYLNKIKNARLGREVRDAIHDAISTTYDDAVTTASPNAEVAAARGTYVNLKARLDAADAVATSNSDAIDDCEMDIVSLDARVDNLEAVSPASRKVYDTYTDAHTGWVALSFSVTVPIGSVLLFCIHDREQSKYHNVVAQFYNTGISFIQNVTENGKLYVDFQSVNHCNVKLTGFTGGAAVFRIVKIL